MKMSSKEDKTSPKSNRRRRWEVKSKESFETSLAMEIESPPCNNFHKNKFDENKNKKRERPQTASSLLSKENNIQKCQNDIYNEHAEEEEDLVSAKLSVLLNTAKGSPKNNMYHQKLRDSDENLIDSELKNYFGGNSNLNEPSAPPLTPESVREQEKLNKTPKRKVSVKVSPDHLEDDLINSKVTDHLKQLTDDVKDEKKRELKTDSVLPNVNVSGLLLGPSSSSALNGNISTIYCERLNNFVISENYFSRYQNEPINVVKKINNRKSHALALQTGFRTFSIFCQGLIGGITIAHCLMIFLLGDAQDILIEKKAIEHVFFSIIFFLLTLCLVSSFDRCDVTGQGVFSEHGIRIPWTPLFYFISLTLTLIAIKVEDIITHHDLYPTEVQSEKERFIYWWKYVCLSRTIFIILAWTAVIKDPHTDALNSRITEFSDN